MALSSSVNSIKEGLGFSLTSFTLNGNRVAQGTDGQLSHRWPQIVLLSLFDFLPGVWF